MLRQLRQRLLCLIYALFQGLTAAHTLLLLLLYGTQLVTQGQQLLHIAEELRLSRTAFRCRLILQLNLLAALPFQTLDLYFSRAALSIRLVIISSQLLHTLLLLLRLLFQLGIAFRKALACLLALRYTLVEHILLTAQLFNSGLLIFYFVLQLAVAFGQLIQLTLNCSGLSLLAAQSGCCCSKSLLCLLLRCRKAVRRRLHLVQTTQKSRQTALAQLCT